LDEVGHAGSPVGSARRRKRSDGSREDLGQRFSELLDRPLRGAKAAPSDEPVRAHEHGTVGADLAVAEAGIPASSVYHYFGSKGGVLLAVMERGADRFFAELPDFDRRIGSRQEHLRVVETVGSLLDRHPDFLRILVVMAAQPTGAGEREVHPVVSRVRELALQRLRKQMEIVFALDPESGPADHLARFALAAFDGAFVARQSNPQLTIAEPLEHLPAALAAVRRELSRAGQ
jgi:AcrR family transcriptional regulator